jgi:hypothetical protein
MRAGFILLLILTTAISGCAQRSIYLYDENDQVVGECMAGFDWHFYGIQDSIDYILYKCAKGHVANGYRISDPALLSKDVSLPAPPDGKKWNKKLAMHEFKAHRITEQKLGYILAEIEYRHIMTREQAETQLANNDITTAQFELIMAESRRRWQGE